MILRIILFISLALLLTFGTHFFLYKSVINFFDITDLQLKKILIIIISFLSISFIVSLFLTRAFENIITKYYYLFSSIWYGALIYFLLACILVWLVYYLQLIFNFNINLKIIFLSLLSIAFLISIYGVYNATIVKTKQITVNIKNLPVSWQNKTAVQISDLHLGIINSDNYIKKIVKQINDINPDIVFITGDLFDGTSPKQNGYAKYLNNLNPTHGIYFVTGNHETYLGDGENASAGHEMQMKLSDALDGVNINILEDKIVNIAGINIIGIGFPKPGKSKDMDEILKNLNKEEPNILLYHEPRGIKASKNHGINLQLAGHTHQGQQFPYNIITRLIYKKYHHGLHTEGDYNIYTTAGTGTWGPPVRVGSNSEIVEIKFN